MIRTDWESAQPVPDGWPDLSFEAIRKRAGQDRSILDQLGRIPRESLRPVDQTLYDLFQRKVDARLRQLRLRMYLTPFWTDARFNGNSEYQVWAVWAALEQLDSRVLVPELRLRKLNTFPIHVAQVIALMREGAIAGMLPSRATALTLAASLEQPLRNLQTPEESSYYKAFDALYGASDEEGDTVRAEALRLIRARVEPAIREFVRFVEEEYAAACPEAMSLAQWPDGEEIFRGMTRDATGTGADPAALHDLGMREAARIREEMQAVVKAIGWKGSLDEFFAQTRVNPSFYFTSEAELLAAYRTAGELIASVAPQVVSGVSEVAVEPMRTALTAASFLGSENQIRVDVSRLDLRPRFEVIPVMLHEGPPGHAAQVQARANAARFAVPELEMVSSPNSAYIEGWGLYAESLGEELGLYTDPLARFGKLNMELLRAARLVLDTGIHALGWSRDKATRTFMTLTGRAEEIAQAEVRRTNWPASQLVYEVGQEQFLALRKRAESVLGDDFDVVLYHDTLLSWGSLPFDLLQNKLDTCLEEGCLTPSETQR